jgi:type IV pilus assembly protein PilC
MFSRRLTVPTLVELCRSMRFSLTSGLMLRDTMDLLANKGMRTLRPVAASITQDLKAGWGLQDALAKQEAVFPPMFLALASVGEESGNLPEVLSEMERYYELQRKLQRDFWSEISWPLFQFCFAVLVLALLICVLGILQPSAKMDEDTIDPLGLGLLGPSGALQFLAWVFGTLAALWFGFVLTRRLLNRRAIVERTLLALPLIGSCLRGMALTRFCFALRLMLETNLSLKKTLRLSLQATDNEAFMCGAADVETALKGGNSIVTCLSKVTVFPEAFLSVLAVAEECGKLPEALLHQAEYYDELARRRMVLLNRVASWLIWLGVALVIMMVVFRIFNLVYLRNLERYLS